MTSTTTIQSASLHFREGNSDKVYHAAIEPKGEGYLVTFAYGRRGNTLTTGTKTTHPVNRAIASVGCSPRPVPQAGKETHPRGKRVLRVVRAVEKAHRLCGDHAWRGGWEVRMVLA